MRLSVRIRRRLVVPIAAALLAIGLSGCLGWFVQFSSADDTLASIACLSSTTCVAVGGAKGSLVEVTDNSGGSWMDKSPSGPSLSSVSCGGTDCVAVGDDSVVTTADSGTTWASSTLSLPQVSTGGAEPSMHESTFTSVSCVGQDCWAATSTNTIEATTDGGRTWAPESWAVPAYAGGYAYTQEFAQQDALQLTCPTTQVCVGVGKQTYLIYPPPEATIPLLVVEGGLLVSTSDGGQHWAAQTLVHSFPSAISCSSATSCLGVGSTDTNQGAFSITSTDGGASWTVTSLASVSVTSGVDCVDANHCIAVGDSTDDPNAGYPSPVQATSDGGVTWNPQHTSVLSGADLHSIACVSATSCWAVGTAASTGAGVVIHTVSGGEAWPSISSVSPSQGPVSGGTTVTVTGLHFDLGVTGVSFGGVPAQSFSLLSASELTAVAPAAPGGQATTVDMQVTSHLGRSPLTPGDEFTYTGG